MDSNVGCEDLRALDVELRPTTPFSKGLAVCFRFNDSLSLNNAVWMRMLEGFINLEIDFVSEKGLKKWSS